MKYIRYIFCVFAISDEEESRSSHLLFTLHIYQYRIEKANQAGLPGGEYVSGGGWCLGWYNQIKWAFPGMSDLVEVDGWRVVWGRDMYQLWL